jgi:ATP-dependent Clp protease adaptor protein ClpS
MDIGVKTLTKEKVKIEEPGLYDVIFLNDNLTTQDFVIRVLKQIFNKSQEQATSIMGKIHNDGQGIVGSYVHEVAEQKGIETTLLARQENFPLQVKVKKQ